MECGRQGDGLRGWVGEGIGGIYKEDVYYGLLELIPLYVNDPRLSKLGGVHDLESFYTPPYLEFWSNICSNNIDKYLRRLRRLVCLSSVNNNASG